MTEAKTLTKGICGKVFCYYKLILRAFAFGFFLIVPLAGVLVKSR